MDSYLSIAMGIGLSAACGFRVFVPLLVMSVASMSGQLTLLPGFEWIGTDQALTAFAVATIIEILGFYLPWVDHLLDTLALPFAIIAGTVITASFIPNMSPFLKWTLAIIAGGGPAGIIHGASSLSRILSSLTTGGFGNFLVSTAEFVGALCLSMLAIAAPILASAFVVGIIIISLRRLLNKLLSKKVVVS